MAEGEHAEWDEEQRQEEDVAAGERKDDQRDRYGYSYDTQHVTFSCDAVAWRRTEGPPAHHADARLPVAANGLVGVTTARQVVPR